MHRITFISNLHFRIYAAKNTFCATFELDPIINIKFAVLTRLFVSEALSNTKAEIGKNPTLFA